MATRELGSLESPRTDSSLRALVLKSALARVVTVPLIAAAGLATAAAQVRYSGAQAYGLISLISTLSLLLPFADLGLGAAVTTAVANRRTAPEMLAPTLRAARRRLALSAAGGVLLCVVLTGLGLWDRLLGVHLTQLGQIAAGLALGSFFVSVPLGLSQRILVGLDRSHVAAVIPATASVLNLGLTALVIATGAGPVLLSVAMPLGVCLTNLVMLVVAVRLLRRDVGLTPRRLQGAPRLEGAPRLLAGSGAMLLVSIGLPLGLQSGRLLLSHTTDLDTVAEYAVDAQFYGIAWGVLSAAGMALWPAFVRLRTESGDSLRQWRSATLSFAVFGGVSAFALGVLAPVASRLLTGGHVHTGTGLAWAFGLLLFVQALHLPTGMMLTRPSELRWQAVCVLTMALVAVLGAAVLARPLGAVAVPLSAGLAIFLCQVIPDQLMTRTLLARRPRDVDSPDAPTG